MRAVGAAHAATRRTEEQPERVREHIDDRAQVPHLAPSWRVVAIIAITRTPS